MDSSPLSSAARGYQYDESSMPVACFSAELVLSLPNIVSAVQM